MPISSPGGFNGAALGRARRYGALNPTPSAPMVLQRGRARESAEMASPRPRRAAGPPASTGPRSGERGDTVDVLDIHAAVEIASTGPRSGERGDLGALSREDVAFAGFNGAALGRARRSVAPKRRAGQAPSFNGAALGRARRSIHTPAEVGRILASTGPRSGERGDDGDVQRPIRPRRVASTGPRSGERGDLRAELRMDARRVASTGPRSGERGDETRSKDRVKASLASTGPRSGERGDALGRFESFTASVTLQRGRARESAEMRCTTGAPERVGGSFNGAALGRARRCSRNRTMLRSS